MPASHRHKLNREERRQARYRSRPAPQRVLVREEEEYDYHEPHSVEEPAQVAYEYTRQPQGFFEEEERGFVASRPLARTPVNVVSRHSNMGQAQYTPSGNRRYSTSVHETLPRSRKSISYDGPYSSRKPHVETREYYQEEEPEEYGVEEEMPGSRMMMRDRNSPYKAVSRVAVSYDERYHPTEQEYDYPEEGPSPPLRASRPNARASSYHEEVYEEPRIVIRSPYVAGSVPRRRTMIQNIEPSEEYGHEAYEQLEDPPINTVPRKVTKSKTPVKNSARKSGAELERPDHESPVSRAPKVTGSSKKAPWSTASPQKSPELEHEEYDDHKHLQEESHDYHEDVHHDDAPGVDEHEDSVKQAKPKSVKKVSRAVKNSVEKKTKAVKSQPHEKKKPAQVKRSIFPDTGDYKVEEGEPEDDGKRKSKRMKIAPLAYWKNEKVVYGRRESGIINSFL